MDAVNKGQWQIFFEPEMEEKLGPNFSLLQEAENAEAFGKLWGNLWEKISSTDGEAQALPLRHLNRLQWNLLPHPLQSECFKNLRKLISETRRPANYHLALSLAQNWIPQAMETTEWGEIMETTRLLKEASEKAPQVFDKQNYSSRVALEGIFSDPVLDSLLARYEQDVHDSENIRKLFLELGHRAVHFLFQKIETEETASPVWKKAAGIMETLESAGLHVYEATLDWPEKSPKLKNSSISSPSSPPRAIWRIILSGVGTPSAWPPRARFWPLSGNGKSRASAPSLSAFWTSPNPLLPLTRWTLFPAWAWKRTAKSLSWH